MSVFTNPTSRAPGVAQAYVRAILELLGDRDPMGVLAATPAELRATVGAVSPERLRRPEAPGKWSMIAVLQHLADSDIVWAYRLRMVLAHDRPELEGYDQDAWVERLRYAEARPDDALEQFRVMRDVNLRLLRSLSPAERRRVGIHRERGEESVELMIRLYAGHDLAHLRQLRRIAETQAR